MQGKVYRSRNAGESTVWDDWKIAIFLLCMASLVLGGITYRVLG